MKNQKRVMAGITCLQVFAALFFGGLMYCQSLLIGGLEHSVLKRPELACTAFFLLAYMLAEIFENYVRERLYAALCAETRGRAAGAFLGEDMCAHGEKTDEQHISFLSNEVSAVLEQNLYLRLYVRKQIILFCFSVLTLFVVAREYSIVVVFAAALFGAAIRLASGRLDKGQRLVQDKKAAFVERLMELYRGFEEIHINQIEKLAAQDFTQANADVEEAQYRYRISLGRLEVLGVGQNMIMYILILIAGGMLAGKGAAGIGVFVSAAELSVQALGEWTAVTRFYTMVRGSAGLKKELDAFTGKPAMPCRRVLPGAGELLMEVRGLRFGYEEDTPLLEGIDFTVRKGGKYLITGESGCGKSTLLELLAGHKACKEGEIRLYTDKIAYLPQSPFLFAGTLKENLIFDAQADERAVRRLMDKVGLDLPLDTEIRAEGDNLSGGQKARIALVRALLTEPALLIADEITASLDSRLGERIEALLLEEYPETALCVVAHRVYCREKYTSVLELCSGRICEVAE